MIPKNKFLECIKKLKWVEEEFIKPSWIIFCQKHEQPITLTEFDEFCYNLFTDESKVKALSYAASVDFVYHEMRYALIIGCVDEDGRVLAFRPILWKYRIK